MKSINQKIAIGVSSLIAGFTFASNADACTIDNNATSKLDGLPIMEVDGVPIHYRDVKQPNKETEAGVSGYNPIKGGYYKQSVIDCDTVTSEVNGVISYHHFSGPNNMVSPKPFKKVYAGEQKLGLNIE